jgi:hypothetical protein
MHPEHVTDHGIARAHDHKFNKKAQEILIMPDELAATVYKHPDFLKRIFNPACAGFYMIIVLPATIMEKGNKKFILGFKVIVQPALCNRGTAAYGVNRGFVVAVFIEARDSRLEYFLAPQASDLLVFHTAYPGKKSVQSNVACPTVFFKEKKSYINHEDISKLTTMDACITSCGM